MTIRKRARAQRWKSPPQTAIEGTGNSSTLALSAPGTIDNPLPRPESVNVQYCSGRNYLAARDLCLPFFAIAWNVPNALPDT